MRIWLKFLHYMMVEIKDIGMRIWLKFLPYIMVENRN